ncbi:MAG: hypothetical protein A2157_19015 [Deltaproteobacteria bacterium RBG_16_47_11]|nr:MAG: hypothetical protein A2157_19015 [Deltaproteobacteria bacterium RBG_16_47_11]
MDRGLRESIEVLGKKIRTIRSDKAIRLRELSSRTKLSIGALSQIERGIMTPSLSSMILIAHALQTPMGDFFDSPELTLKGNPNALCIRKGEETLLHSSKGVSVYLLYHDEVFSMEIVKNIFEISGTTGDTKYQHEGEEWGMVLKGRLRVELGKQAYILNEGDSICLKSNIPHRLINISSGKTIQIWFNSPPLWINKGRSIFLT